MPTKAEKTYLKRMNNLKSALGNMAMDGTMTQNTHSNLLKILETEVEVRKPKSLSKPLFPIIAPTVNRSMVPDEIPPPALELDDAPPPPPEPAVEPAPESDLAPVCEEEPDDVPHPEPVPESASEQVDEHPPPPADELEQEDGHVSDADSWYIPSDEKAKVISPAVQKIKTLKQIMNDHLDHLKNETDHSTEMEPPTVPEKGCLFMACIRCASMIMIKFESKMVPPMPLPSSTQYENGIVMTMCKQCELQDAPLSIPGFSGIHVVSYVDQFSNLKMSPDLLTGTDMVKTANAIVGEVVHMMEFKGRILYVDRTKVMDKLTFMDTIVSLDLSRAEFDDLSKAVLPYLKGGFI
jgi:hypothetical protein